MKNHLGRLILLVEDYEPALQFYQKNFEFETLFDITTSVGQRFLHIGTNSTNAMGIWFLKAEGKEQKERIGKQTAGQPTLVIYTTSLSELYDKLKHNNVRQKPHRPCNIYGQCNSKSNHK